MDALLKPALLWPVPVPEIIALLATALMPGPGLVLMPGPGLVLTPGPGLVHLSGHCSILCWVVRAAVMPSWRHVTGMSKSGDWA